MKYLKTFEKHITLELDDSNQVFLMNRYITEYDRSDINEKKIFINRIKNLFKNGFDPNVNFVDSNVPFVFILETTEHFYDELLEVFVKYGLSGEIAKELILSDIMSNLDDSNVKFLKKLKVILNTDINFLEKQSFPDKSYIKYNKLNFFEILDKKVEGNEISRKYADRLFDIIKNKKPEQYQQYLIQKNANKYNL
jgi:hypothetical protein